jgi:hypothetical protein
MVRATPLTISVLNRLIYSLGGLQPQVRSTSANTASSLQHSSFGHSDYGTRNTSDYVSCFLSVIVKGTGWLAVTAWFEWLVGWCFGK